jgi:hypothetical protein
MFRKRLPLVATLISATFLISFLPAQSATIAGTKCTKLNSKKTVANIKYTCVKSGNKLVWNKGILLKPSASASPKPIPSESPSIIPTPEATSTAKPSATPSATVKPLSNNPGFGPAGRIEYRFVDGILQRKNEDGIWRSDDSRNRLDFDAIRVAAFESIWNKSVTTSNSKIIVTNHITANYPTQLAAAIQNQISGFISVISPYLTNVLNMDLVLVTEKDKTFIDTQLPLIINKNYYGGNLNILNEYTDKASFYRRSGTGGGTAGFGDPENRGYYLGNTASFAEMETYWPEVAPHEMAHAVQFFLARGFVNNCGEGEECGKWHGHLIEGSANAVGMAIGFPVLGWYSDEMDKILKNDIRNYGPVLNIKNEDDVVALFKRIETRTSELNDSLSYSAGQVLWEYYIGTYGFQKWIDLYANLSKTANFNENLKMTIGIDKQFFYKNAAPYFLSVWKRLS